MKVADYNFSYREKDGGWQIILSYKVGERWRQKSRQGFRTKREANSAKNDLLKAAKKDAEADSSYREMRFRDFVMDIFIRDQAGKIELSTIDGYRALVKILHTIPDMPMTKIGYIDLMNEIAFMRDAGKNPNSINLRIRQLKRIFKIAVSPYKVISSNPAAELKPLKVPHERRVKALNSAQLAHLMEILKANDAMVYTFCAVAAYNGLRFGEIAALTWDDVDFRAEQIRVSKQLSHYGIKAPKSENSMRTIPASPQTLTALHDWKEISPSNVGQRIFNDKISAIRYRITDRLHAVYPDVHIHTLRHTFATILLKNGADVKTLAAIIGDTPEVVISTYIHYTDDLRERASDIVKTAFL